MKHILPFLLVLLSALLMLLLASVRSYALIRKSPTPVLHSIFDAQPAMPANIMMTDPPCTQPFGPQRRVRIQTRAEHDQKVGIGLIIGGAALSTLGAVLLLALAAEDGYRFPDGSFGLDGAFTALFALMIAGGLGMIIPGAIKRSRVGRKSII